MGKNFVLDGGVAYCAYSTAVGRYYYVTVVNSYSTVDFTTTFWFTCYVYKMPLNLNVFNKESSCIISSYLFVSFFFIHRLWRVPVDMCMKVTIRSVCTGPGSINQVSNRNQNTDLICLWYDNYLFIDTFKNLIFWNLINWSG